MNKIIKIIFLLIIIISTSKAEELNSQSGKAILFPINECILKIPYAYNIGVSKKVDIEFGWSIISGHRDNISISLNLTEKNATKVVLEDLKKSKSSKIDTIHEEENLIIIEFINKSVEYIIGKKFYIRISNKENKYAKELISNCNKTYKEDLFIENIDMFADKMLEKFPYSLLLTKKRALLVQQKLEKIYKNSIE